MKNLKPSNKALKEFAEKNSWHKQMAESQGLDSFNNYSGPSLGDLVVVLSRSRDSELLTESNFDSALERLGGESKNVTVERFGHWACGWFELILVNPKHLKSLKIAYAINASLKEYPVLDESDFSERENQYQHDYAMDAKKDLAKALSMHFKVKYSNMLVSIAYELNMERQGYSGNDACVNIYTVRKPDAKDVRDLKRDLDAIEHNYKNSKVFKTLVKNVSEYKIID